MKMHRYTARRFFCSVCGTEANNHSDWFLVVENCWLDRLKVLDWHPLLAEQAAMRCVCGKLHLKTLITHWLTHANLQFLAAGVPDWTLATGTDPVEPACGAFSMGRMVGELAIHREALSRAWSGSPEALECILNALIGGLGTRTPRPAAPVLVATSTLAPEYAIMARAAEHRRDYALP
jgi:hypothetical protein